MATRRSGQLLLAWSAAVLLLGCAEGGPFAGLGSRHGAQDGGDAAPAATTRTVERDIEAPEIYQVADEALWDGRPSLGGVWVAATDVKDPERVIIRNEANGKFVVGALFRRERENPGPKLQVSSDAADALGMLAGAPTRLNVTALKREEVAPPPEETPEKAPAEAVPGAAAIAPTEAISSEPLDKVVAGAASAIEKAAPPQPAAAPKPAAAKPAAPPAPAKAAPKKPALAQAYVQIGIFSVEANATGTAKRLEKNGMAATVKKSSASGKAYWRVVVGPAPSAADRAAVLKKVKALGFTDAYPVSG